MQLLERQLATGDNLVNRTQSSFHDAAGCAEDVGGTGGQAERRIKLAVRQAVEIDAGFFDHLGQFAGCQDCVDIRHRAVFHFRTGDLELLGCAGHDRNNEDVARLKAGLLGKPGLDQGTQHHVR